MRFTPQCREVDRHGFLDRRTAQTGTQRQGQADAGRGGAVELLRFWRSTINTPPGLAFAIRSEQAVREELAALVLSLPLAWLIGATTMRRIEMVAAVVLVLVVELLNTAIEKLSERLGFI